jgi:hypothetical protein
MKTSDTAINTRDIKDNIRKTVGESRNLSPLQRAFQLKKMCEAIRGERMDLNDENVRRVVGRIQ